LTKSVRATAELAKSLAGARGEMNAEASSPWFNTALYLGRTRPISASPHGRSDGKPLRHGKEAAVPVVAPLQEAAQVRWNAAPERARQLGGGGQQSPHYAEPVRGRPRARPSSAAPRLERRLGNRAQRRASAAGADAAALQQRRPSLAGGAGRSPGAARRPQSALLREPVRRRRASNADGAVPFWERLQQPVWAARLDGAAAPERRPSPDAVDGQPSGAAAAATGAAPPFSPQLGVGATADSGSEPVRGDGERPRSLREVRQQRLARERGQAERVRAEEPRPAAVSIGRCECCDAEAFGHRYASSQPVLDAIQRADR